MRVIEDKKCAGCKTIKKCDEFYKRKNGNCLSYCKVCTKLKSKQCNKDQEGYIKLLAYQKKRYAEGKTKNYYVKLTPEEKQRRKELRNTLNI